MVLLRLLVIQFMYRSHIYYFRIRRSTNAYYLHCGDYPSVVLLLPNSHTTSRENRSTTIISWSVPRLSEPGFILF